MPRRLVKTVTRRPNRLHRPLELGDTVSGGDARAQPPARVTAAVAAAAVVSDQSRPLAVTAAAPTTAAALHHPLGDAGGDTRAQPPVTGHIIYTS